MTPERDFHVPTIEIPGPFALHDQACAVCWDEPAVYVLHLGVFEPGWKCQQKGWRLRKKRPRHRLRRRLRESNRRESDG